MSFHEAAAVVQDGPNRFTGTILDGWDIGGNANGGYLLAIAASALVEATGKPDVVTISAHYMQPGRPGPVPITVTPYRIGGRHATASAIVGPPDAPVLVALATTTDLSRAEGPEFVDTSPPEMPDPEDCVAFDPATGAPPFAGSVDVRIHPDDVAFRDDGVKSGKALVRGWFRLRDGEAMDSRSAVMATDAFPPTVFNTDIPIAWVPTVELTAHVRARPPADPSTYLRCAFRTQFVAGGYLEEAGELWGPDGRLVAQSRQLALVPKPPT